MDRGITRRTFNALATIAAFSPALTKAGDAPAPQFKTRAPRPTAPYRVWYQPRLFIRDMDLYSNMTVNASGWLDPRLAHATGKCTLDWLYGNNHPSAKGPDYWRDACLPEGRRFPRKSTNSFLTAGAALDEWVKPAQPENDAWLAAGLRAGRKESPEVFLAVWVTDATQTLIDLARDGTVDLLIVEGYTHSALKGQSGNWDTAIRRIELLAQGGVLDKTIYSFGHIDARRSFKNESLGAKFIRERAEELKRRYPQMPGVAFFQNSECPDSREFRDLIRTCDRTSLDLWPDKK